MKLPQTEKSYLNDPYTVSFRARVVDRVTDANGRTALALDRSYFYPESGGQTADVGTIGSLTVVDVQEREGESTLHFLEGQVGDALPEAGVEVDCRVDWERRFDHMQQHTGQHVLSRAFIQTAGLHTVSFHLGEDACTIDLEGTGDEAGVDAGVIRRTEDLANSIVADNRPVIVKTLPAGELERLEDMGLRRSLPEGVTEARLVEVKDFDVIPCCGTHVKTTGELGVIKILKSEKAKQHRRVYFKAGARAFQDYRDKHDIVQSLGNRLTTSAGDVVAKVDKLVADGQRMKKDSKQLSQALAAYETRTLLEEVSSQKGARIIVRYFDDRGDEFLRMVSAALKQEPDTVAVLGAATGAVVCCASEGVAIDFNKLAVEPAKAVGGGGGGKGTFAQVKLPLDVNVRKFMEEIGDNVKRSIS